MKKPILIAVAGPMNTMDGENMKKGAMLYRDDINSKGGIHGRDVELIFYDDEKKPQKAKRVAQQINEENKVMLVLGHFDSECSLAAGKIYKSNEMPVITASATRKSVIAENEWYFRVVPDNAQEANFVCNYIEKDLNSKLVSIIFSDDEMGLYFEKYVQESELSLTGKWKWEESEPHEEQLRKIEKDLENMESPGVVFLATNSKAGAMIVTALKNINKNYRMIGSHVFGRTFMKEIEKQSKSLADMEYYSDGIYYTTHFMDEIGGADALRYGQRFKMEYGQESGEVSAVYYDAMMVGTAAIKKSGPGDKRGIREGRRNIKSALVDIYSEKNGVKGITGNIYFDQNGGARMHYAVGIWHKGKAFPALTQYRQVEYQIDDLVKKNLEGTVILMEDNVLRETKVVHVKTEILKVCHINNEDSEFTAEFNLSFRFKSNLNEGKNKFDYTDIRFENAAKAIDLGKPVVIKKDRITTEKYRIKGTFKTGYDFQGYPFGNIQKLPLRFHHKKETNEKLIYIPENTESKSLSVHSLDKKWYIGSVAHLQDISSKKTTLGNPKFFGLKHALNFSRLNTEINIKRKGTIAYVMTEYLPFF
jgi:branched-chain amino acid transport system substrate-binding protein